MPKDVYMCKGHTLLFRVIAFAIIQSLGGGEGLEGIGWCFMGFELGSIFNIRI